jgi:hypothetical protein
MLIISDATPNSLKYSNVSPKMKTMEEKWIRYALSFVALRGQEGHAEAPGWGLERVTSKSIIHIDLYKPNNNLVNA